MHIFHRFGKEIRLFGYQDHVVSLYSLAAGDRHLPTFDPELLLQFGIDNTHGAVDTLYCGRDQVPFVMNPGTPGYGRGRTGGIAGGTMAVYRRADQVHPFCTHLAEAVFILKDICQLHGLRCGIQHRGFEHHAQVSVHPKPRKHQFVLPGTRLPHRIEDLLNGKTLRFRDPDDNLPIFRPENVCGYPAARKTGGGDKEVSYQHSIPRPLVPEGKQHNLPCSAASCRTRFSIRVPAEYPPGRGAGRAPGFMGINKCLSINK